MMLTGARAHFCAGHRLPQHEEVHGHSYEVWAFTAGLVDVEAWQDKLEAVCGGLDHKMLDPGMATMEQLAQWFAERLDASAVRVIRPVEGLSVEWTR